MPQSTDHCAVKVRILARAVPSTRAQPLRPHSASLHFNHTYVTLAESMFSRAMTPAVEAPRHLRPPSAHPRSTSPNSNNNKQHRSESHKPQATASSRDDVAPAAEHLTQRLARPMQLPAPPCTTHAVFTSASAQSSTAVSRGSHGRAARRRA